MKLSILTPIIALWIQSAIAAPLSFTKTPDVTKSTKDSVYKIVQSGVCDDGEYGVQVFRNLEERGRPGPCGKDLLEFKNGKVYSVCTGKILSGADAKSFRAIHTKIGMMSSQVLFFVDKDQVWSPTLVPRTDVDPQTIGKDKKSVRHNPLFQDWSAHLVSGCYTNFISDKNHVYDQKGKKVPHISPNSQYLWDYYIPRKVTSDTLPQTPLGYRIYKNQGGLWRIPADYSFQSWTIPQKVASLKKYVPFEASCD